MIPTYKEIAKRNKLSAENKDQRLLDEFEKFIVPKLNSYCGGTVTLVCPSKFCFCSSIKSLYASKGWDINFLTPKFSCGEFSDYTRVEIGVIK